MDAINLPPGLTLPTAFGAPAAQLQAGQVIQALVLELIESNVFRLQLPQAIVDVRASVPLTPGSTITLAVKTAGPSPKLVIYPDAPSTPAGQRLAPLPPVTAGPAPAPSLAGRQPIGEAVIIARAPAGQGAPIAGQNAAPAPGRVASEPAVLRDAPSINPSPAARPVDAAPRVATPEQAVAEAVRVAAPRQASLAPLFADIEQVAQVATQAQARLPAPVRTAAADILSLRGPLDEQLTAADVRQAFVRSGVLFEPRLAAARSPAEAPTRQTPDAPAPVIASSTPATRGDLKSVPAPGDDLKAALLVFRQVLKTWAASEPNPVRAPASPIASAPGMPEVARAQAPLPRPDVARVQAPLPQPGVASAQAPLAQPDVANIKHVANVLGLSEGLIPSRPLLSGDPPLSSDQATILARTLATALVSRDAPAAPLRASPHAVPPPYRGAPLVAQAPVAPSIVPDAAPHEAAARLIAETDGALARQTLLQVASLPDQPDLPRTEAAQRWSFEVPFATPQGTAIAQFEVSRDGGAPKSDPLTRVWRARFSLDVEPMGPVHAMVALSGTRASVTLWAERVATATRLNENAALLNDALRAAELEPGDFQARVGAPPAAAKQAAPGRFMDRAS